VLSLANDPRELFPLLDSSTLDGRSGRSGARWAIALRVEYEVRFKGVQHCGRKFSQNTERDLATNQVVIMNLQVCEVRGLAINGPAIAKLFEIERCCPGKEKHALIDKGGLAQVNVLYALTCLEHLGNRGELQTKQRCRFSLLKVKQVLARGQYAVEDVSKNVDTRGRMQLARNHCRTPLGTNAGARNATGRN